MTFLALILIIAASACAGGGGGAAGLSATNNEPRAILSDAPKGTAILIKEDEITTLPHWQQELLSDSGWNDPYIEPRAKTQIEPPTPEMLMEDYNRVMEEGIRYGLHGQSSGKSASYMDQDGFALEQVLRGEYNLSPRDAHPPYGCNWDGTNGSSAPVNHAFDDVIREGTQHLSEVISYVLEATTTVNWFNTTGGAGNDAQSAVYQLFSTHREANPEEWLEEENHAEFEELCYRADLAPGIPPGGDCSNAEAFLVSGMFWKRFNSFTSALPDADETLWFNVLIAPASDVSDMESSDQVDGRYQEYYFGTVDDCFGGAWIVGLEYANTGCEVFDDAVNDAFAEEKPFFYTPVYGVLLKRWQQMQLSGMDGPWESEFGWPVWGPVAYKDGAQMLSPRGAYYAWGMWFERGFIWWLDYDQAAYPNTPDEAQVFTWTGWNVFDDYLGHRFRESAPAVFYGGSGPLGVSIVVDSYRDLATDPWQPVDMDAAGMNYIIALPSDGGNPSGTGTVNVAMHAHAYGGVPHEDGSYDWYVWAFRDGTIAVGNEADAQYLNHAYGSTLRNMEQVYVVRVQVTDAEGNLGYGDSVPINLVSTASGSGTR